MRITQGAFSFLPDLTDEEISAQIESIQPSLGALLRATGGDAGLPAARMAQQNTEATAV